MLEPLLMWNQGRLCYRHHLRVLFVLFQSLDAGHSEDFDACQNS